MNRKRKLTWIEKKQIEKMAFDHPFFDIPGSVLSKKEAEAIIRSAEARKSGVEIVSEACDRVGIPRPDSVDNRSSIFDNLKEIVAIPAIRRIGIIVIALILLVVFFAATPIGRAIAESVIQYITTLFDDGRVAMVESDNTVPPYPAPYDDFILDIQNPDDITSHEVEIESFDAFIKATGKTPVTLPLQRADLYYDYDDELDYLELCARYETSNGVIITYQIWNADEVEASTSTGYHIYDTDNTIYYSVEENGDIAIVKTCEDSIFSLTAIGSFTLDEIISMVKDH